MSKDPYKYFRIEARELIHGLGQGVLELERGTFGKGLVGSLLRLAHTLKGAARVVKLTEIARLAHALEDALAPYRDQDGSIPQECVDVLLGLLDAMAVQLAEIDPTPIVKETTAGSSVKQEPLETVRIEIEEMDLLLEGVTEATVQVNSLRRESETIDKAHHLATILVEQLSPRRAGGLSETSVSPLRTYAMAEELREAVERLQRTFSSGVEQVSRELGQVREATNRLRLLPANAIFGPLERAVRDAAQLLGKKVEFSASGGDGRLDAHVLAMLRDALLHVVRNAVAHGIESNAGRTTSGKPATGHVDLTVERRGHRVAFVCRDDGQGIDVEGLRREAVRAGVLSSPEAASADTEKLFRLLFRGGLTTARTVTEVSGRGIGLDVVRETVNRLHGEVIIRSQAGLGTSIDICVPVSLSSLSALVVDAAGVSAVVPLDAVRRTLRLAESEIARAPERDSVVYEGKVIPFLPLAKVLRRPVALERTRRHWSAVVVQSGHGLAAVGVDHLRGTATAVVRPLPPHLDVDEVVVGASLDAEGNPQLVLDANGLVNAVETARGATFPERAPSRPILVIDDSLTTRMLEQSILESAGYEVDLATSAEEALLRARERRYGLFVVDVEMPGMDGFEFVTRTRADVVLRETPAILVTSLGSPENRQRGQDAGASAYIVKGEFDQVHLLEVIRGLLG